ncbi:MAG: arginine deiminase-related protein [Cyanobacteria bacterium P01_E01_bin.42]
MLQIAVNSDQNTQVIAKIQHPCFLMSAPFFVSADVVNNPVMQEVIDSLSPEDRVINIDLALSQFQELYGFIASKALVYLLPSYPGLQDQTYVANLGIVLPHLTELTVVISNYYSEVRRNESEIGREFFKLMKFPKVMNAPEYFEGEADLKYLRDNVYCCAHGLRTSKTALDWFAKSFDMKVIPIRMEDPYLYHLDCLFLPLSEDSVLACTEKLSPATQKELEKYVRIYDLDSSLAIMATTNALILGKYILVGTNRKRLDNKQDKYHQQEKDKLDFLEKLCTQINRELVIFDLSEFEKSGAALSCLIMNLNYKNYNLNSITHTSC